MVLGEGRGFCGLLGRMGEMRRVMVMEARDVVGAAFDGDVRKRKVDVSAWKTQG